MIDTDSSGQITFEELKAGLKRFGANLKESEIYDLMQAVSSYMFKDDSMHLNYYKWDILVLFIKIPNEEAEKTVLLPELSIY